MNESLHKFWSEDWVELQKNYWENWNSFAEQAGAKPENPWSAGLDHWWQAVSGAVPNNNRSILDHMLDQSKRYFDFADLFSRNASQVKNSGDELKSVWEEFFQQLQQNLSGDNFILKAFTPDMDA